MTYHLTITPYNDMLNIKRKEMAGALIEYNNTNKYVLFKVGYKGGCKKVI